MVSSTRCSVPALALPGTRARSSSRRWRSFCAASRWSAARSRSSARASRWLAMCSRLSARASRSSASRSRSLARRGARQRLFRGQLWPHARPRPHSPARQFAFGPPSLQSAPLHLRRRVHGRSNGKSQPPGEVGPLCGWLINRVDNATPGRNIVSRLVKWLGSDHGVLGVRGRSGAQRYLTTSRRRLRFAARGCMPPVHESGAPNRRSQPDVAGLTHSGWRAVSAVAAIGRRAGEG